MSEKIRKNFRITEEENQNLIDYANACGMSQQELMTMLLHGKHPQPIPPESFWEMLEQLYHIHDGCLLLGRYEPNFLEQAKRIEILILRLQKKFTQPKEVEALGYDKPMAHQRKSE